MIAVDRKALKHLEDLSADQAAALQHFVGNKLMMMSVYLQSGDPAMRGHARDGYRDLLALLDFLRKGNFKRRVKQRHPDL